MTFRKFAGLAAIAAVFLSPIAASAKPALLQCVLDNSKSKGWIADQIYVEYDAAANTARVVDGIILHFNKRQPAAGKITENTSKKMVVTWSLNARASRQTTKMAYRAAVLKPANKVLVTAKPHGFADNLTARGRCQPVQGTLPTG